METRTLTIECTQELAKTLVELLLSEPGSFSISVSEHRNGVAKVRKTRKQNPTVKNKGLRAVLEVGMAQGNFMQVAVEERCRSLGLHTNSASPALFHAKAQSYVNKDGKVYNLTEKGRQLYRSWGLS